MPDHDSHEDPSRETQERLALPLLVPAIVFLFAVLVVYGLSRIYLELDTYHIGDVGMATPLAIGVAIVILLIAAYFASRPIRTWQVAFVGVAAASLLTAGSIWAAVHEEKAIEPVVPENGTPGPGGGGVSATLKEFSITLAATTAPGGAVTFDVKNDGSQEHEFMVISTDLAPDALPYNADEFKVDESQVNIIGEIPLEQLQPGTSANMTFQMPEGPYVIICNVASHYENGMHASFAAGPPAPGGGPGGPGASGPGVDGSVREFAIELAEDTAPAGSVAFNVTNEGAQEHEFMVISTDLAPDALPYNEDAFIVDESQLNIVGEITPEQLQPGASASLTFQMPAGPYVIICNVPSHYENGMHAAFTAGPAP